MTILSHGQLAIIVNSSHDHLVTRSCRHRVGLKIEIYDIQLPKYLLLALKNMPRQLLAVSRQLWLASGRFQGGQVGSGRFLVGPICDIG